jgi:hypothetical protein
MKYNIIPDSTWPIILINKSIIKILLSELPINYFIKKIRDRLKIISRKGKYYMAVVLIFTDKFDQNI